MEALSSHPNQSRLQGHNPWAFAPGSQQKGAISILKFFKDLIFEFAFLGKVEETVEHAPGAGALAHGGSTSWTLRDGVSTSASSASALCPLLPSPLGNPGCGCRIAGSVGKASGTREGLHVSWQVSVFLRSYFVLKNKYKPLQQVKTEIAARRKMPLLRILNKGACHFHFALGPTNHMANPSENCFIAQPLTKILGMKMNIYQEVGSFD